MLTLLSLITSALRHIKGPVSKISNQQAQEGEVGETGPLVIYRFRP